MLWLRGPGARIAPVFAARDQSQAYRGLPGSPDPGSHRRTLVLAGEGRPKVPPHPVRARAPARRDIRGSRSPPAGRSRGGGPPLSPSVRAECCRHRRCLRRPRGSTQSTPACGSAHPSVTARFAMDATYGTTVGEAGSACLADGGREGCDDRCCEIAASSRGIGLGHARQATEPAPELHSGRAAPPAERRRRSAGRGRAPGRSSAAAPAHHAGVRWSTSSGDHPARSGATAPGRAGTTGPGHPGAGEAARGRPDPARVDRP